MLQSLNGRCGPCVHALLQVSLPAGMEVGKWQDQVAELFRLQEFEARVASEEAARAKEAKRLEKKQRAKDAIKVVERRKVRASQGG